jgi:hypothetical protein
VKGATSYEDHKTTDASGNEVIKPIAVFNPVKAAGILRDMGHPDLANAFMPNKPVKNAVKMPANGTTVRQGSNVFKIIDGQYVLQQE